MFSTSRLSILAIVLIFLSACGRQRSMEAQNSAGDDLFPIPSNTAGSNNKFNNPTNFPTQAPTSVDSGVNEDELRRDFISMFEAISDSTGNALDEAIQILSLALAELVVDVGANSKHIANLVPLANSNSARIGELEKRATAKGCRVILGNQTQVHSTARCAANEKVVSGGMHCESANPGCGIGNCKKLGFVHANRPGGNNDWVGDCYGANGIGDVTGQAFAICCRV